MRSFAYSLPAASIFCAQAMTTVLAQPLALPAGAGQSLRFASGLRNPHDIVFHALGATPYVYIADIEPHHPRRVHHWTNEDRYDRNHRLGHECRSEATLGKARHGSA